MILFIFLQIDSHFPASSAQLHSTFCVCQNSYLVNCSKVCGQYKRIDYKSSSISNCIKEYDQELINFLIVGTMPNSTKLMPKFNLYDFENISAIFYTVGNHAFASNNTNNSKYNREHIIMRNGTAGKNTNILFTNVNIHFLPGKYKFNNLYLFNTDFTPFQKVGVVTSLYQKYLSGDYGSISRIPIAINHYGPIKGAEIECDININHIQFLKNLNILFSGRNEQTRQYLLDLSQVSQKYNTTIILNSRDLNITFDPLPTSEFDIPKIIFKMQSNSKIFINSDQFENEKLPKERITFIHKSKTLYLYSKNGTTPPIFSYVGNGYRYSNDKKRTFYNNYCICPKSDCEEKCGKNIKIINSMDSISLDETVVGNPSESLTYLIANSKDTEGNYPVFDLEHFGDRKLSVIGATSDEHVGFIGDATDDVGEFSFSRLIMHTKNGQSSLLFPNVSFHNVKIYQLHFGTKTQSNEKAKNSQPESSKDKTDNEYDKSKKSKEKFDNMDSLDNLLSKRYFLKCTYLIIDYATLKNFATNNVAITAPQNGVELHAASIEGELGLCFFTSNQVEVNKLVNVSLMPHTSLTVHATGNINFFLSPHFPKVVSSFPKLRIVVEGDQNTVSFMGESGWPKELADLSAKVTFVHGDATVFVNGQLDSEKKNFLTKPPVVDHRGSGPFFLNGVLSNFKDAYCVCQGEKCSALCANSYGARDDKHESLWPPVNFSEKSIEKTVVGNPTRQIEYFIHASSPDNRPLFGLHTFQSKSFSIIGCNDSERDTKTINDEDEDKENSSKDSETQKDKENSSKDSETQKDKVDSNKDSETQKDKVDSSKDSETQKDKKEPNRSITKDDTYEQSPPHTKSSESASVFQYVSLEGTDRMTEIVSSSVSHHFAHVDILLSTPGIYFFNNVVFTDCRIVLNESVSLVPRDGMTRFFKIIHSGMTVDMPTLHSFMRPDSVDISVPSTSYMTVNGGYDLSKIVIDDMYHLTLLDSEEKLDSRIDVSLLKRNPPQLKTLNGDSQNKPLLIEWGKNNNDIHEMKETPRFILDVSDSASDDVYVSFTGNKWLGEFNNLSSKITIKHDKINVYLISQKVVAKKDKKIKKIRPPIVNFDGIGDLYIDGKKQLSKSAFINGNILLMNNDDYLDDNIDNRDIMSNILIIAILIIIFIVCLALFAVFKHKEVDSYGKMGHSAFFVSKKFNEKLNELPIEPFKPVEDQSD